MYTLRAIPLKLISRGCIKQNNYKIPQIYLSSLSGLIMIVILQTEFHFFYNWVKNIEIIKLDNEFLIEPLENVVSPIPEFLNLLDKEFVEGLK